MTIQLLETQESRADTPVNDEESCGKKCEKTIPDGDEESSKKPESEVKANNDRRNQIARRR